MKAILPFRIASLAALSVLLLPPLARPLGACSTVRLQAGKELIYGHNLNANGLDVPGLVFVNPRGIFKTGRSWMELVTRGRKNPSSLAWISRYGSVTFNAFGRDLPDGGMNEAGLFVWEMGLSNEEVVYPKNDSLPRLNQMQWMQYVLDNFSSLEEAVACAREIEIDGWGWHFFLGDAEGNCAAIDFVSGRVVVHRGADMPVPGLFNALYSREVEWSRYFQGFGGTYEVRLDDPRVPRFVKAARLLREYDPSRDPVAYGFQLLDRLFVTETADWSVLFDLRRQTVHFRTSRNRAIKRFSISAFDFSNSGPLRVLDIDIPEPGDVTSRFAPLDPRKLASFISSLPIPDGFFEGGGLKKEEAVGNLATHTDRARTSESQFFAGTWRTPANPGKAFEIRLRTREEAVYGEIATGENLSDRFPLRHIRMIGNRMAFTFRSGDAGPFFEATVTFGPETMVMELWEPEASRGRFELFPVEARGGGGLRTE